MNKQLCLVFLIVPIYCKAQVNLVQNPSFEDHTLCPEGLADVEDATGWSSYRESSDYFNSCASWSGAGTPDNLHGFQYPHSGNAYCGVIIYDKAGFYREAFGTQLLSPLITGKNYTVSFFASLALKPPNNAYAANNIGAKFTLTPYAAYFDEVPVDNHAQIHYNDILRDTTDWTLISGSFTADAAYQYIAIGNFFDDAHTDTACIGAGVLKIYAYYYVDDVSVICLDCDTSSVSVIPNIFTPNNDGSNDEWVVDHLPRNTHVQIYDRWGLEVNGVDLPYSLQGIYRWDGRTTSGETCSDGVYYYIINTPGKIYEGFIQLMR